MFKVGDRVKVVNYEGLEDFIGTIATIGDANSDNSHVYGIEFDMRRSSFHSLHGQINSNNGWFLHNNNLKLINKAEY